jgi:drug/metabolite transporter, DME family
MAKDSFTPSRPRGLLYALASGLVLATGPLFVRLVETADSWQIVVYRSGSLGVALFLLLCLRYGPRVFAAYRAIGWQGVAGAICLSVGYSAYVIAMRETTVANAAFVMGAFPAASAAAGWLFLGEKVRKETWIAILGAAAGVGIMVQDGLAAGHLLGNAAALVVMITMTFYMVAVRSRRDVDMLPALSLAGLLASVEAAAIADSLVIPAMDLATCLFMGGVQVLLGFLLYTLAARNAPLAEVALLGLGEMVFGPLIAWGALDEVPSTATLIGGAIVLTSVATFALAGMRKDKKPPDPKRPDVTRVMTAPDLHRSMAAALSLASVRSEEPANAVAGRPRGKARRLPPETFDPPRAQATEGPTLETTLQTLIEPVLRDWVARNAGIVTERIVKPEVRSLIRDGIVRRLKR